MAKNIFSELHSKKREWQVTYGTKGDVAIGAENTIGKALALRCLEIPVGEWVKTTVKKHRSVLPVEAIELLESNAQDELKHEEILNHLTAVHGLTTEQMESEAKSFAKRWSELPDPEISLAARGESSLFFVLLPILRMLGSAAMRTAASDISNDENTHAKVNTLLANEFGYSFSPELNSLRKEIIEWLVDDLDVPGKWGNKMLWIKSSESLLEKGVAPLLVETRNPVNVAFFEHSNQNLPVYY